MDITCRDLSELFKYVQRALDGDIESLYDRPNERKMMDKQYDNSNQIALWARDDNAAGVLTGGGKKADYAGDTVWSAVFITREKRYGDNSPVGDLWLRTDKDVLCVPIFKNDKGYGGQTDTHWVNLYKQDSKPPARVKFRAKDAAGTANSSPPREEETPW